MLADGFSVDQVALDDPLDDVRRTGVVPDPFGINHRDGAAPADTKAVGLRSVDAAFTRQAEFLKAFFQVLPGLEALLFRAAVRLRLVAAEEHMAPDAGNARGLGDLLQLFAHSVLGRT